MSRGSEPPGHCTQAASGSSRVHGLQDHSLSILVIPKAGQSQPSRVLSTTFDAAGNGRCPQSLQGRFMTAAAAASGQNKEICSLFQLSSLLALKLHQWFTLMKRSIATGSAKTTTSSCELTGCLSMVPYTFLCFMRS